MKPPGREPLVDGHDAAPGEIESNQVENFAGNYGLDSPVCNKPSAQISDKHKEYAALSVYPE